MLRILEEMDIMKCLDSCKNKNGEIFKSVAERMGEEGYKFSLNKFTPAGKS